MPDAELATKQKFYEIAAFHSAIEPGLTSVNQLRGFGHDLPG